MELLSPLPGLVATVHVTAGDAVSDEMTGGRLGRSAGVTLTMAPPLSTPPLSSYTRTPRKKGRRAATTGAVQVVAAASGSTKAPSVANHCTRGAAPSLSAAFTETATDPPEAAIPFPTRYRIICAHPIGRSMSEMEEED